MSQTKAENIHNPVLLAETLELLKPQRDDFCRCDARFGRTHGSDFAEFENEELSELIRIRKLLSWQTKDSKNSVKELNFIHANFSEIKQVLAECEN